MAESWSSILIKQAQRNISDIQSHLRVMDQLTDEEEGTKQRTNKLATWLQLLSTRYGSYVSEMGTKTEKT